MSGDLFLTMSSVRALLLRTAGEGEAEARGALQQYLVRNRTPREVLDDLEAALLTAAYRGVWEVWTDEIGPPSPVSAPEDQARGEILIGGSMRRVRR